MRFTCNKTLLFTAQINENNAAFLDGTTDANSESASYISTLPVNISLWHHRFAHHYHNSVREMNSKQLVTGINIKSKEAPDPVCEPCLSGKMNANPFPPSKTHTVDYASVLINGIDLCTSTYISQSCNMSVTSQPLG